jgi:hypothetical protein
VGTLGGLVALRDKTPPPGAGPASRAKVRRIRLHVRRLGRKRARVWLMGAGTRQVRRVDFMRGKKRLARDRPAARSRAPCAWAEAGAAEGADRAQGRPQGHPHERGQARKKRLIAACVSRGRLELRHVPARSARRAAPRQRLAHVAARTAIGTSRSFCPQTNSDSCSQLAQAASRSPRCPPGSSR